MARRWPALVAAFAVTKLAGFAVLEPQAAGGAVAPQGRTAASAVASSRAGRPVSDTEIADAIRRSGLTHEALRTRLQQGGYDPDLANPFFASTASESDAARAADGLPATDAPQSAAEAFQALGIIAAGPADSDGPRRRHGSPLCPSGARPTPVWRCSAGMCSTTPRPRSIRWPPGRWTRRSGLAWATSSSWCLPETPRRRTSWPCAGTDRCL